MESPLIWAMTEKMRNSKNTKRSFLMNLVRCGYLLALAIVAGTIGTRGQSAPVLPANDSLRKISLNATVDTYYHRSFGREEAAPPTSFSNLPGFSLGMVNLVGEYSSAATGLVVDLVFGPRGSDAIFNAPLYKNPAGSGSSQVINQMFIYYNLSESIRLNLGQFNTFHGYEMISPARNANYSTSYVFTFGPFNHTGVWADLQLRDGWSAKIALMNPTDYTEYNPFNSYTFGGQLSKKGKKWVANLNATYGDPDGDLKATDSIGCASSGNALHLDFAGSFDISEHYFVGVSTSLHSIESGKLKMSDKDLIQLRESGYYGVVLYQTFSLSKNQSVTLRTEYFSEFKGGIGAIRTYNANGRASVFVTTLSANFKRSALCFIPEVRVDKTSINIFRDSRSGSPIDHLISLNLAIVFTLPAIVHRFN
jgi:hypothetical protein